jgi:hypothetical protein
MEKIQNKESDGMEKSLMGSENMSETETYRIFLGLMIKHHRVQMAPVQVRAKFWVRERFSAGRAKSAIPARTRHHYFFMLDLWQSDIERVYKWLRSYLHNGSPVE